MSDVLLRNEGTLFVMVPVTEEATAWVDENVYVEDYQRFGAGIVIEHRYMEDIYNAMIEAGFEIDVQDPIPRQPGCPGGEYDGKF